MGKNRFSKEYLFMNIRTIHVAILALLASAGSIVFAERLSLDHLGQAEVNHLLGNRFFAKSGDHTIDDAVQLIKVLKGLPSHASLITKEKELRKQVLDESIDIKKRGLMLKELQDCGEQIKIFEAFTDAEGNFDEATYNGLRAKIRERLDKKITGPTWSDLVVRAAAGDNWKALEGFSAGDKWYNAVAALPVIAGVRAVSKRLEATIDQTLGGVFYGAYRGISFYSSAVYRAIRNKLGGYSGVPFEVHEVKAWRASVRNLFAGLSTIAKDADRLASRSTDKILRQGGGEELINEEWMGIVTSDIAELSFIAHCIDASVKYYNVSIDRGIVHYAEQLSALLKTVKATVLEKTKSYRDLGSTDTSQALLRFQSTVDKYFELLLSHLSEQERLQDKQRAVGAEAGVVPGGLNGLMGMAR